MKLDFDKDVVKANEGMLRSVISRYLGRQEDIEDTLQEVWLKAHKGLSDYRGDSAIQTWLYTIATREAWKTRRQLMKIKDLQGIISTYSSDLAQSSVSGDEPDLCYALSQLENVAYTAIQELPELSAKSYILYTYHNLTYPEIAAIEGVPTGTIKSRIHKARKLISKAIEENQV